MDYNILPNNEQTILGRWLLTPLAQNIHTVHLLIMHVLVMHKSRFA